ncbi:MULTISPECIES: DUF2304 domain-containing protein [Legionella]|uniref:Transmembrane protein n=1 Tax=Legionella steelei TaxID=947033 RepID=A0A0W0ZL80_9GAMM|nr:MULTISPECIES: DUF2304 domain-containing protein [Legionella]KTD69646.1 hypothetical protein Lste_2804 [Legionella steelei]MBN9227196.1 DUF2304 domain-containing protein [Legionella steelei]OJW07243.1 MAG: hypothetical protein BGO44_16595 [Legionella sp. 39-23]
MGYIIQPGFLGIGVIVLVLLYTIHLVRAEKLSAHMAISWIIAELAFLIIMSSEYLRSSIRAFLGEQNAPYSLFLLGAVWVLFLMLESLTRVSSLTVKLKQINQELALTKERLERAEAKINQQ